MGLGMLKIALNSGYHAGATVRQLLRATSTGRKERGTEVLVAGTVFLNGLTCTH